MRITIHQPEHLPWLGLLAKVGAADVWVVLDSVAFRKNYFQNRNRVLTDGQPAWLTVPVTAPHGTLIRDVRVARSPEWQRRYRGRLAHSLPEAARQGRLQPLLESLERCRAGDRLADLNLEIADWLLTEFKVGTPRVRSSELGIGGHKSELIRNLCLALGADEYLAGPSGRDYLDHADFVAHGITVRFFDFLHPTYDQGGGVFVPNLSSVDAVARLSQADLPPLLTGYRLSVA
jgi:hypothetical protein